ncbi:molybdopterin-dependent oxidoreductase [Chelatococcus sp. SYSU_G07232]|uniref:Molybdopterin-dependent oxidoreductase n=1 Tax=Chelatococcus albus TaxID=3047466 RepID=A0ABT7AEJ2_9HYPH|nr:molybdopterin-dependent oxidoreductase [Chelatococcus sp. SYSU_G07232]MDJ1157783.1 molybdopterin-dependent oxidoreductase [Chelatococcus sp. SYSU_G07232]
MGRLHALGAAIGSVAVLLFSFGFALAQDAPLARPTEKPILTISGKITVTNATGAAQFDRQMLEALGTASIKTKTPWYPEPVQFEGVPLAKLMKAVGAEGQTVVATALNDYSAEIPIQDFTAYNAILALKRDGKYMPVQDKGPLFIIYPYDSNPELNTQKFYARSVWQVKSLVVK